MEATPTTVKPLSQPGGGCPHAGDVFATDNVIAAHRRRRCHGCGCARQTRHIGGDEDGLPRDRLTPGASSLGEKGGVVGAGHQLARALFRRLANRLFLREDWLR